MAKLNAVGDVIVITADITVTEYDAVRKHAPEALELKNDKGETYFMVSMSEDPSISKYGICFSSRANDGNIFMTTDNVITGFHSDPVKERALIEDEFATILANLIKVEGQVRTAITLVKGTIEQVADSIHIEGEITE